jgi:flagellar protein FlgJ
MEISALSSTVHPSDLSLEQLAKSSQLSEGAKIGELSRQFEALLLRQILQNIRKSVIKSDLLPQSAASDIYQDMATAQLADSISQSGSFGLAASLEKELTRQLGAKTTKDPG